MVHGKSVFLVVLIAALGGLLVVAPYGRCSDRQDRGGSSSELRLPQVDRIRGDRVFTVLPRDAIPAIDNPRFVTVDRSVFLKQDEPVIGVVSGGIAKAYSVWHLDRHEIVNDDLGKLPVAVTW